MSKIKSLILLNLLSICSITYSTSDGLYSRYIGNYIEELKKVFGWNCDNTVAKGFIRELAIRPFLSGIVVSHIATQAALKIQKRYSKNKNSHDYKRFRNTLKKANEYCYYASTIAFFSLITMYLQDLDR